jgi:hypothetical protein
MTATTRKQWGSRAKGALEGTIAGAIVTALGFFDDVTVGPIVIALAAYLPALATFAVTAVVYSLVQYWASLWLIHHWDEWIEGENGRRFEDRLQKWRQGRFTRRAVDGVTSASTGAFVIASIAFATVDVVAIWKLSTETPMPRRRVALSAVVYGTWCAALWTATGYGIGIGIRSA